LVGLIFGVSGFVLAVCATVFVSPRLFNAPAVELGALVVALLLSQWIYRQALIGYTRTADLA